MELVVLVDEQNNPIGTADKSTVHTANTPLHRAFSLFLFNSKKQLLLTKRASSKKTFPGVWTNTVCGHLAPDELTIDAVRRRLNHELGIMSNEVRDLHEVSPYRYRFADKNGIVENEICPILVGFITDTRQHASYKISPDPKEVEDWKWMDWSEFLRQIKRVSDTYSPWCREEAVILDAVLRKQKQIVSATP